MMFARKKSALRAVLAGVGAFSLALSAAAQEQPTIFEDPNECSEIQLSTGSGGLLYSTPAAPQVLAPSGTSQETNVAAATSETGHLDESAVTDLTFMPEPPLADNREAYPDVDPEPV